MRDRPSTRRPVTRRRAAALGYDAGRDPAPRVLAGGDGVIADRIVEIARAHGIPIHEDRALVDVLARLAIDAEIPPSLYRAVAEVIGFLLRARLLAAQGPPATNR